MDEENSDLQNKAGFPRYTPPKQIYKPVGKRQISNKKNGQGIGTGHSWEKISYQLKCEKK